MGYLDELKALISEYGEERVVRTTLIVLGRQDLITSLEMERALEPAKTERR